MGKWLVAGLVAMGVSIFVISLYLASITGVMQKMGLVGGDVSRAVKQEVLVEVVAEAGGIPQCDYWEAVKMIPQYLTTSPSRRIKLGLQMGEVRIACGVVYSLQGNVERGVYTLIKGLYYERTNTQELLKLVESDKQNCVLFSADRNYGYVEAFIEASEGNARIAVENLYREVGEVRGSVAERCIDEVGREF
ncbi:MAG: hypothetical protein UX38_C0001G0109 [Microgenomates group bacterium GW2011_GWC1_46_16]|uniref:DUF5667 domain-containing protein n=2 Tax=Candidatus Collieribacteriota TaxID=1752725 RepID=A0A1F5FXQ6_9BACT|nr:MAG: hypothetical protein UX32_C0006G0054 [Microgenomates group bacterium GW2011_GWF1_46_12]KKU27109.1 MAG: hypothetical protein UX38_C0001G0109 [Microgenomates group bacterium GW2011_GWC1_46_16]KKU27849.1 MAG: hypothetical protein UX40_C0005G0002 [Microgenomates group bacterium GW2011_GWF2_46_18]KKU43145.1 MAG: hypothetical protein UX59_C0027G0012 [Microgenomates group bacterium GW2011_GWA1_46_7]KKU45079.1 MAG: hypothetical protein UX63_C0013G0029 [Microgenomates group bacterium GW2011_GWB1